jgi:histidyl-tRNA synthetase
VAKKLQAPRGTLDALPEDGQRRRELYRRAGSILGRYGYRPIETPVFEDTELFARGVGESTDIVRKEMFTFEDRGGRSLTLRPEGTASVARAYVEHGMHKLPQPVKVWYWGPFFRHERAQAGRYRQFAQVGVEALGSDDPSVDAECVLLLSELLEAAGVHDVGLKLSSLGSLDARAAYLDKLRAYLRANESKLSEDVVSRIDGNPLRAFDAGHEGTKEVMANAPRLLDSLTGEDAEHFAEVRQLLDDAGVTYHVDATLVRGLDYYTRTVFEFDSPRLGAQSGVGGGGRYDGLIAQLGGPDTPGVGWAAGIERILLASEGNLGGFPAPVFVALAEGGSRREAFRLVTALR